MSIRSAMPSLGVALTALMMLSTAANAVTITFETDAGGTPILAPVFFASSNPLTTVYQPLGVTWAGGGAILDQDGNFGVSGFSPRNFLAYNSNSMFQGGAPVQASDTMTFSTGVSAISFLVGSGSDAGTMLSVTARDAGNAIVASMNVILQSVLQSVSLSGTGIVTVDYSLPNNSGVFVVDNVNFTPELSRVPEPATLALFGLGLAGLGFAGLGFARRRKAA